MYIIDSYTSFASLVLYRADKNQNHDVYKQSHVSLRHEPLSSLARLR